MRHQPRISLPNVHPEETTDGNSAGTKARELLCAILPEKALHEFLTKGFFHYEGKVGVYRICQHSQTEIYRNGRLSATACLTLTNFAPSCDRMIAEYLILKSNEALYWNKANVFPAENRIFNLPLLAMTALDLALGLKLVLDYLRP